MKIRFMGIVGAAVAALLTGCSIYDITQAKHEEASEFLPNHQLLQKQDAKFPFQLFYLKEDAPKHKNVYIAPVNTTYLRQSENWAKFDEKLAGKLGQDVDKLAKHFESTMKSEFVNLKSKNKPQVVDAPTKDCVVIETAIVAIMPNKAELNALGLAGNLIVPGISLAVARIAAGSITVECRISDAETREVLAMYSATINDQAAVISLKALSWYGSAERSLERTAKYTAQVFATSDYSTIKREYPYKLITW